ncbi:hypothetical protein M434DRAFT_332420 [Hypoxylon sp. CO27-5]|nr:hypothetical protein M434DRAFT_332420 [Hypoxylon sp. CO27-5]
MASDKQGGSAGGHIPTIGGSFLVYLLGRYHLLHRISGLPAIPRNPSRYNSPNRRIRKVSTCTCLHVVRTYVMYFTFSMFLRPISY